MKHYYFLFFCLVLSFSVQAEGEETQFDKANQFYQKGDFKQAIAIYEGILKGGNTAAALYFNLGNAYFKIGNVPSAILNYERAAKLAPQDEDIQFNLHLANLKVVDKITPIPEFFITRWWHNLLTLFHADAWAKICIGTLFVLCVFIIGFFLAASRSLKKVFFSLSLLLLVFFVLIFTVSSTAAKKQAQEVYAILFTSSTYVKGSPDEKSTDLFILHEGTKMKIIDQIGSWKRIRLADGNEGWVKEDLLKLI